jgi:hypothetical protein
LTFIDVSAYSVVESCHIRFNNLLTVFQSGFRRRVYEWAAANGFKLNPIKSQVIVISRCRVDIPPPMLLIGSDVIKVVPKVNNLGFVLNERLTATDHFKKVCQKVYWILRSLRPHASHTPFEVRRRLVVSLIMSYIGYVLGYCVC